MNRKKIVLGNGETTGHQHTIRAQGAKLMQIDADRRRLVLPRPAVLRHEHGDAPAEHRDIRLPAGEPIISHKRQYNPEGGWSPVAD